ncbi:HAD family hydrolase [Kiloniella sp.]|uniref:HAD family hydrolase n=1 Tax=Kiloniella sp. TaxID=1938587 RepID=UPI003B015F12
MPFQPDQLQAVVFDMDGVLIDSEVLYQKSAIQSAKEHGFLLTEELHRSIVGLPQEICDTIIREAMGPDFPFEKYNQRYSQILATEFQRDIPVKSGVKELLTLLTILGIPTAVATSSSRKVAIDHLTRAELVSYFNTIVTRDDVNNGKPHPEPYLSAAGRLQVKPENCLALEDSHNGVRSAHGAGMQTIMVPDMLPATEEIRGLCIAIMTNLHQVRDRFKAS